MEIGTLRQSMPRLRGGQWASEHCVQKVEEMLSRAITHQEDLLGLLTLNSIESASPETNSGQHPNSISPPVLRALKAKIENSMDWCHLALCRLREIVLHTSSSPSPSLSTQYSMGSSRLLPSYPKRDAEQQHQQMTSSSPRLNAPTPLSPLRVLLRKEPPSSHPFSVQGHSGSTGWNPNTHLFSDPLPFHAQPGEGSSSQQHQRYQQQDQNFARLPVSMDMDNSDWPLLSETGPMSGAGQRPPPLNPDPRQCSSSCQMNPVVGSFNGDGTDHLHYRSNIAEDQSDINKMSHPMRGSRSRHASGKSEVRKLSGGEAKLEVVFQKLNDAKKGIPDDGHRGWKKYGNKSIQNSNHCRGYYKCSVKECRAKKMVQPTDKDPTLFEVTYVGKHTCSSTGQRRGRSTRTAAACNPAPVDANESSKSAKEEDRKSKRSGGMELDDCSILTGSNSMTEENGWSGIIPGSSSTKRGRSEDHDKASLDNYSYLHTMTTTSTTTTTSEDREMIGDAGDASIDTYLHQSSRHHQAVYSFQEPLLWHDFDMDTKLSTDHKSTSMDSGSSL